MEELRDTGQSEADNPWKKRFERERARRKEAEILLERKSLELFEANQQLTAAGEELRKNNEELVSMLEFVNGQKSLISDQHEEISQSMAAAKRIQQALLPSAEQVAWLLGEEHFVLFKPRNTISGDFYWVRHIGAGKTLIVAADCTGHGVPGAFMSLIGHVMLNRIVIDNQITLPDHILYYLNRFLLDFFAAGKEKIYEGMEAAVLLHDATNRRLRYAGAGLPLYYVEDRQWHEIKADRQGIGGSSYYGTEEAFFQLHEIKLTAPTRIFLCTDGYQDQFGGPKNRKFMSRRFKQLLHESSHLSVAAQGAWIEQQFEDWRQTYAQTDDILVLGWQIG